MAWLDAHSDVGQHFIFKMLMLDLLRGSSLVLSLLISAAKGENNGSNEYVFSLSFYATL